MTLKRDMTKVREAAIEWAIDARQRVRPVVVIARQASDFSSILLIQGRDPISDEDAADLAEIAGVFQIALTEAFSSDVLDQAKRRIMSRLRSRLPLCQQARLGSAIDDSANYLVIDAMFLGAVSTLTERARKRRLKRPSAERGQNPKDAQ